MELGDECITIHHYPRQNNVCKKTGGSAGPSGPTGLQYSTSRPLLLASAVLTEKAVELSIIEPVAVEILDTYNFPYNEEISVVCMNEKLY